MPRKPAPLLAQIGTTGLKQYSGYVREEWHKSLQGTKAAKVYREMWDNEPIISAGLHIIDTLVRAVDYRVEPDGDSPDAKAAAEFGQQCIDDLKGGMKAVVSDALTMLVFGWASQEKCFKIRRGDTGEPSTHSKYSDGKIGWHSFAPRAQETLFKWEFGEGNEILGWWQAAAPHFRRILLPRERTIHYRLRADKDNPEGRSLLRGAYTSYYHKKNHQFTEAVGIERNLAGFPVAQVPYELMAPGATPQQQQVRASIERMVQKIRVDEMTGLVFPSELDREGNPTGYKFGLINSGGRNVADTDVVIKRYSSQIAMTMMVEFLLLGQDGVGSLAMHGDKTSLFAYSLNTILDSVVDQINEDAFPELMKLNGYRLSVSPKLVHGDTEKLDLQVLANYVTSLSGAGAMVVDNKLEEYLREQANLPKADALTFAPAPSAGAPQDSAAAELPQTQPGTDALPQQSLNGAQISSLMEVVQSVAAGQLPRESALAIITTAFPIDATRAEQIMGTVGRGFVQATETPSGAA
jgi:hypothetical protein